MVQLQISSHLEQFERDEKGHQIGSLKFSRKQFVSELGILLWLVSLE